MVLDLARDTLFVTLAGSHAHGTAQPGSDVDLRGVCIAPLALRLSLFQRFEQYEGALDGPLWDVVRPRIAAHPSASAGLQVKTECVIFDLAKFLRMCAEANPNALEILFSDQRDWLYDTAAWRRLHRERHRFLSKKVQQTYLGYALAQLKKVKLHREADASGTKRKNPARAALISEHGYDTKHAMHLVRLMQTGLELLETGDLRVRRPDAEQLRAVRDGSLSFEQLLARAAELEAQLHAATSTSTLPDQIDFAFVDDLALQLIRDAAR